MPIAPLTIPPVAWPGLVPLILLAISALALLLLDAFVPASRKALWALTLVTLFTAFGLTCRFLGERPADPFPGMFASDDFAHVFDLILYLAAMATVLLARDTRPSLDKGEFHSLLLLATAGMVSLAHAANLVTVFLSLELLSVVLYVLTGFLVERARSLEAALKYFFLGAFASAFLVFGIALVYGSTGSFDLAEIGRHLAGLREQGSGMPALLLAGGALLLVGLGFKISSVPFHMWTPDVYEGAPTPVAAFMSVATKAASFAALLRVFTSALGEATHSWRPAVAAIAILTMLVGNIVALTQKDLKRLLAFSSVAHAGYALIGLVAWDAGGREAVLFYLAAYAFMNLGAFAVVASLEGTNESLHAHDLDGLSQRRPWAAAAMALFLLSLAGVPPTAGFVGKFNLLLAAIEAGWIKLAILGALYSIIAAYYYLRIIVIMYMRPAPETPEETLPTVGASSAVVLWVAAAGVLALGLMPGGVMALLALAAKL